MSGASGTGAGANGAPADSRGYEGFGGFVAEVASASIPSWPPRVRAREGAPNVIVVLLDDLGFSDLSPFGSEIDTPAVQQLAESGYRFTNYHSTPVCSPARAALLTGLNPHRAGFASVVHADPGFPGYVMEIADDVPTIAESFRASGYATFMVGKWHLTTESKMHDGADKASWPLQRGFDRYYGSMDGFTTLFHPHRLVSDNSPVTVDEFPDDYYLTDDLTDRAVGMIRGLRANDADKPFFLYFAHHAVHGPIQAKAADIEKYRGAYERGWDHIRSERFARQVRDGLFPPQTVPAPRNEEPLAPVTAWDDLGDEQRALFARYMEVYAAAVDNVDQNLARLVDALRESGEYENTIIVVASDNGGTGEGGAEGTRSYFSQFVQLAGLPADWERDVDRDPSLIGGPRVFAHYPAGWAYASNTPFRLYKGATYEGGIRVPLVVSWPAGLPRDAGDDGVRDQYTFVTDLGQTLLSLAGVKPLASRTGLPAKEVDGVPFDEVLRDADAPAPRTEQYSEFAGNRAFVSGRWKIVTDHRWTDAFTDAEWRLYDLADDPTERVDLAGEHPERVAELAGKWRASAWSNTVFPLGDDGSLFTHRPSTELELERPVTLYPGTPTLERFRASKLTKLRSFDVEVRADLASGEGTLVAHGDQGGGYALQVSDGRLTLAYNEYGRMHRVTVPVAALGGRDVTLRFEAVPGIRWLIGVEAGGERVAELGPVLQLVGMAPFTGISVGVDRGGPVDWDVYEQRRSFPFSGVLHAVRYVPGAKAEENPEVIVPIERELARIYE
ncbi:arylsulfatase [Leifsonia sp. NCR5]|uniref:arylsulfatase n=1 Tax=Leifsonia sp. NCR5 TaxID=1978342 RepID=UPI000A19831B|nr:arylsulfatase [Leifsonia sp. NCR5]